MNKHHHESAHSKNQALYEKAKTLIPGGTQLLSKRPEMYAPSAWPPYYQSAKGCEIIDLDGRKFQDFSTMGIGCCLLGYANDAVNTAVIGSINRGNMTTLNAAQEVELAELLLDIHPWAEAARFTRTGGEALAVAIRIARAATGRSKVAICGYHGWHDWYLSANLAEDNALDGQLLPGLEPRGVPRELTQTTMAFRYNKIEELESIIRQHGDSLAAVVMEPMRMESPNSGFLSEIKDMARRAGAVLIFDEVTVGWRYALGGLHLQLGVSPDIAVFAKAMSNGYPMAAVIGTHAVMHAAQGSFISSTYWTESIGPTAALATIRELRSADVWPVIRSASKRVAEILNDASQECNLPINLSQSDAMVIFSFKSEEGNVLKTLYTKKMMAAGFLASSAFYATFAHKGEVLERFSDAVKGTFDQLARLQSKEEIKAELDSPEAHTGFRRLT